MAYIDLQELRSYIGAGSTATTDDSILSECLSAAQKEIENECKRSFESSTGTRYYRSDDLKNLPDIGGSGNVLWLGKDLLSVSTLSNGDADATEITSTGYWLEPRNSTTCYQYIRLRSSESWVFGTDGEIIVAGTWGYSTGPDATITQLTKEFAAYLYRMRDNPVYEVTAMPDIGQMVVPKGMPVHVKRALHKGNYVRKVIV